MNPAYYQRGVFFFEKPVTDDEIKISGVLNNYFAAWVRKDLRLLADVFSENAVIQSHSFGESLIPKAAYVEKMKEVIKDVTPLALRDTVVRFYGADKASVFSLFMWRFKKRAPVVENVTFELTKEENLWKISKYILNDYQNEKIIELVKSQL